jgi:hypothetical protein
LENEIEQIKHDFKEEKLTHEETQRALDGTIEALSKNTKDLEVTQVFSIYLSRSR